MTTIAGGSGLLPSDAASTPWSPPEVGNDIQARQNTP